MAEYTSRVSLVYVATLTSSWTQILTKEQSRSIRGVKIKARLTQGQSPKWFDIAFNAAPDETDSVADGSGFISYTSSGFGDMLSPSNGMWARTRDNSNTAVIEITTFC